MTDNREQEFSIIERIHYLNELKSMLRIMKEIIAEPAVDNDYKVIVMKKYVEDAIKASEKL